METLARLGFAARGLVYLMVGWLALKAAVQGGQASDNRGALASLAGEGLGQILLFGVAAGLFGYGAWRLLDALFVRSGRDAKRAAVRLGHVASGIAHLLLGAFAGSLAIEPGRAGAEPANAQDRSARDWTAWLLDQPFGEAAVIAGGIVLVGVGLYQWRKAYRADFLDPLGPDAPSGAWFGALGRIGFAARGAVFVLVGLLIATAGFEHDPGEAGGIGKALTGLQAQPYGPALLGAVALGLVLFGLFSLVEAKCRRLHVPDAGAVAARLKEGVGSR